MTKIDANAVEKVGKKIARCDFQVMISGYVTHESSWKIVVGESHWKRELTVRSVSEDGEDAELALIDINGHVEREIMLKELISGSYTGVKEILMPTKKAAA